MSQLESQTTENLTNQDHDDIDDDDDQTNSLHKIITNPSDSIAAETNQSNNSNFDVQNLIKNDLETYLNTSIPKHYLGFVRCHIKREKQGLTKGFSTTFSLYFDGQNGNDQIFLLIARKHLTIGGHSEYFIGTNPENPTKNLTDENSIAKLRGTNINGTEYILYDHQNSSNNQKQSLAIIYDDLVLVSNEPRKLIIILSDNEKNTQPSKKNETIIDQWRSGHPNNLIELKNKTPTYNEVSKVFTLNLQESRVKQPSHKNFQIISSNEDGNNVVMQFGRIDDNNFALDYRYPLTAIQAFAIALSSFHNRFRT